jgi:hypothetical protein
MIMMLTTTTTTTMMMMIIYCNNNFNAKCWATVGPKLSVPPDYWGPEHQGVTALKYEQVVSV